MKNPAFRNKPTIAIHLRGDQEGKFVPSYTTSDEIQGDAVVTALYDTSFDNIYLTLEGNAKTFVETIATAAPTNGRTEASQVFLRLVQPLSYDTLPISHTLEAGRTYTFPFTFVVPEKLLPQSCTHPRADERVHESHLNLPPSLGDPMTSTRGKALLDDMSPEMAVISYAVKLRITHGQKCNGKPIIAAESSRRLRIIPVIPDQGPLSVSGGLKDDYRLRKEKEIKKGIFKGRLGCLTIESTQPKNLRVPALNSTDTCPITTMASVDIRFDPADEGNKPPSLKTLTAKLKVHTFFASVPLHGLPGKTTDFYYSNTKGVLVETVPLSSRCVASAQWEQHSSNEPLRRDSAFSTLSGGIPAASSLYSGRTFYTSRIVVPITLPKGNRVFVPTFHSCLISRVYTLDLQLTVNPVSPTMTVPSLHIKVPIQISSEGNYAPQASSDTLEADEFFSARTTTHPAAVFVEQFSFPSFALPSPEYSETGPQGPPSPPYTDAAPSPSPHLTRTQEQDGVAPPGYTVFAPWNPFRS